MVTVNIDAGLHYDRRTAKRRSGRREFSRGRSGWNAALGFLSLPLFAETLNVLRLLREPLLLRGVYLLELRRILSSRAKIAEERCNPGESYSRSSITRVLQSLARQCAWGAGILVVAAIVEVRLLASFPFDVSPMLPSFTRVKWIVAVTPGVD
jgi:hypothetical protein